jgi:hypothetical protein
MNTNVEVVENETQWVLRTTPENKVLYLQDKSSTDPKIKPSKSGWIKAIKSAHPEYVFIFDKVDKAISEVSDLYDPSKYDEQTGEVLEPVVKQVDHPQPEFINPLKPKEMETETKAPKSAPEVEATQQAEVVSVPVTRRMRKGMAIGTEFGVKAVVLTVATGSFFLSDIFAEAGKITCNVGATAIRPLGLHPDATRAEISESLQMQSNKALLTAYTVPQRIAGKVSGIAMRQAINNALTKEPITS